MKFKCKCGEDNTDEILDAYINENELCTIAYCIKCGKKYTKFYSLKSFEEWKEED